MTLQEAHKCVADALSKGGFPQAVLEAKWLLAEALKRDSSFIILHPNSVLSLQEEKLVQAWLHRRLKGEPLSRIRGTREFWSLPFALNEHTLDPRPDTEILVEGVLSWIGTRKNDPWSILDLGTGSGCILISLLHELPHATGVGIDLNEKALEVARHNAEINGVQDRVRFCQSSWTANLTGSFDIIVSNPPYIPLIQKDSLSKEVRDFDPALALFGGEDGLDCYRLLAQAIRPFLTDQGLAAFEIGEGQRVAVEGLFEEAGFKIQEVLADLAGIERVILVH